MNKFIILLPLILFLLSAVIALVYAKLSGVSEIFREHVIKEGQEITQKTSASRFILFLTGLTAIINAVGILTYFLYASLTEGIEVEIVQLESIMQMILYLGIGVVPYGANQLKNLF